jgi:predicted dehydrogenase
MKSSTEPVRIAMLGSGFVAGFYMQGLADVGRQVVVANYSRSSGRAQEFAKQWNIPHPSTNLDESIARDDIDLYIIALPNEEHLGTGLKLARAGKNQVCTKPLGRNRNEARQLRDAALASGTMHGYAETEVFAPAVVRARQTIENGGIGKILWVRSRESHSGPHSPQFWDAGLAGGGAMLDLGCHCIEAARYFFGKEDRILEVLAWGATLVHSQRTKGEDNALLVLRFASGGISHCEMSWTTKGGLDLRN